MKLHVHRLVGLILLLNLLFLLASCVNPLGEREYAEDLYISIPDSDCQILIKEWNYLLGSGEEVYFVRPSDKHPQLLGTMSGGDDGYLPFANGKYAVHFSEGTVTFSWSFNGGDSYTRSESFILPEVSD